MSRETDFLQQYLELKYLIDTDIRFRQENIDLAVEITVAEANPCTVVYDPRFSIPSTGPGQKSYLRGHSSELLSVVELGVDPTGGLQGFSVRSGLRFSVTRTGGTRPLRHYAYAGNRPEWEFQQPFRNTADVVLEDFVISLVPFAPHRAGFVSADGRVHARATLANGQQTFMSDVRLDPVTEQLMGYGPPMAIQDLASVWTVSFFFARRPPG